MTPAEATQERQAVALERIADALAELVMKWTEVAATEREQLAGTECQHPAAEREDRGSTMGMERWRCKLCGYEHVAPTRRQPQ